MTKKQLEEKVAQLEKIVMDLQSQVLTLSFRSTFIPAASPIQAPYTAPNTQPWPGYPNPYIGDFPSDYRTVTCVGSQSTQSR
jgi:hypothetical protein